MDKGKVWTLHVLVIQPLLRVHHEASHVRDAFLGHVFRKVFLPTVHEFPPGQLDVMVLTLCVLCVWLQGGTVGGRSQEAC